MAPSKVTPIIALSPANIFILFDSSAKYVTTNHHVSFRKHYILLID